MDNKLILLYLLPVLIALFFTFNNKEDKFEIISVHDHIQDLDRASYFLEAMDKTNIKQIWLVGSPDATIYKNRQGFEGYDKNNEELLKIIEAYPNKFIAFCTIKPEDPEKLNKLKNCISKGAKGLKLYTGHSLFHTIPLNDPLMDEIYSYVEENKIPITFHVNGGKYKSEFEEVLKKHPNIIVNCAHFCLLSLKLDELSYLLDTYPNLYIDISFGSFAQEGLERLSKDPERYRNFIVKYSNRILFGTDLVITDNPMKTTEYIIDMTNCYKDLLEKDKYSCFLSQEMLNGLNLNDDILKRIYEENPNKLIQVSQ